MTGDLSAFQNERTENISRQASDMCLRAEAEQLLVTSCRYKYSYNFDWLGLPVIQYPQDIVAIQEILWKVKPDFIVETGVARGGSVVFYASMLRLMNPQGGVIGVDVDIRKHNRDAIENHFLSDSIELHEGSSTDPEIFRQIQQRVAGARVVVVLDSNHTHQHVLDELRLYSALVSSGSYLIVLDTVIEDLPDDLCADRAWGAGNSPKTAVHRFLSENNRFEIDRQIQDKLLITVAPDGYLRCIQ